MILSKFDWFGLKLDYLVNEFNNLLLLRTLNSFILDYVSLLTSTLNTLLQN